MSRAIKFRAWYKDGYIKQISFKNEENMYFSPYNLFLIKPEIRRGVVLEQCTGLKDKNGKESYEGDIVEIDKYGKFQIIWNEWACKFDFDKIGEREREEPLLSQDWEEKSEVIGNVHENPELLGGKE